MWMLPKKNLANSQNTFEQTKNFMAKLFGRENKNPNFHTFFLKVQITCF